MTRIITILFVSVIGGSSLASAVTIGDAFQVTGNSDVVGNKRQFDAGSVQVTTGSGTLSIDILTNYDNSGLHSVRDTGVRLNIGDLFFTVDGTYSYGIPLAYHNGPAGGPWGDRLYAGHVYAIESPDALLTARQALHDPMYIDYRPDAIVWMVDLGDVRDVTVGTPSVQVTPTGNDGVNGPLYHIHVATSLPAGLFSSPASAYGLEWAVTTGGNDLVGGKLNFGSSSGLMSAFRASVADGVPEPSTWYMMIGAALVAIARLAARRR